jgi:serine/threonine protein kinase
MTLTTIIRSGTTFAKKYRVLRMLREGGMSVVYVAEDMVLCRTCALKVLLPTLADDTDARKRFAREVDFLLNLKSQRVVRIWDAGVTEDTNTPWLAMELLQGEDLGLTLPARAVSARRVRYVSWDSSARLYTTSIKPASSTVI